MRITTRNIELLFLLSLWTLGDISPSLADEKIDEEPIMALDYGSEWIKVAVWNGRDADVVLNENSKRKSLAALAIPKKRGVDELRLFGEAATARPQFAIQYVRELLGKSYSKENKFGPHYFPENVKLDPSRGACKVVQGGGEEYSPEVLNAMLLTYVKGRVQEHTGRAVGKCVIAVPSYFSEIQRRSLLASADIAGLEVTLLLTEGLALAFKYGIERMNLLSLPAPRNVLFLDVGATKTTVTIARFVGKNSSPPSTSPSASPSNAMVEILSSASDANFGGSSFTAGLVSLLVKRVDKTKKLDERAMKRLQGEANKAKEILSANKEVVVTVEDLVGDFDLRVTITRQELEEECRDTLVALPILIDKAIRAAGLNLQQLHGIEVVGGAWRPPMVLKEIERILSVVPGRRMNPDESIATGAALVAFYRGKQQAKIQLLDILHKDVYVWAGQDLLQLIPSSWKVPVIDKESESLLTPEGGSDIVLQTPARGDLTVYLTDDAFTSNPFATFLITRVAGGSAGAGEAGGGMVELHFHISASGLLSMSRATLLPLGVTRTEKEPGAPPPFLDFGAIKEMPWAREREKNNLPLPPLMMSSGGPVELVVSHAIGGRGFRMLSAAEISLAKETIKELERREEKLRKKSEVLNTLEAKMYMCREKLSSEIAASALSVAEMALVLEHVDEIESWMEEKSSNATYDQVVRRLQDLEIVISPLLAAIKDKERLLEARSDAKSMLERSKSQLESLLASRPWLKQVRMVVAFAGATGFLFLLLEQTHVIHISGLHELRARD
uniref:Uncharacterized protein n=1 Tax=Guillardia theta TaxID=55529 RepID=A0A7S4NZ66_GUITH|mmetsp:Transcript_38274/g.120504  ORF Transcript_38274/g.120504 Transcript_38274/m.120504 type:complete len:785 (+) Transcript_38274:235-2589(+)